MQSHTTFLSTRYYRFAVQANEAQFSHTKSSHDSLHSLSLHSLSLHSDSLHSDSLQVPHETELHLPQLHLTQNPLFVLVLTQIDYLNMLENQLQHSLSLQKTSLQIPRSRVKAEVQ